MFVPPSARTRERILAMGGPGSGKSYNYYSIARRYLKSNADALFYVIDTDVSVDRMLTTDFTDVDEAGMIRSYDVFDWETASSAISEVMRLMRPQDWCMVDMISPTWDWAQVYFTEQVFSKDRTAYMMEMRKAMNPKDKNPAVYDGWKDWTFITGLYNDEIKTPLLRCPGHLYVTSEVKAINADKADKDLKAMFGAHGVIPVGQKRTPHIFQSVLWCKSFADYWEVTSIKDRGRALLEGTKITDFSINYLVQVAKWKIAAAAAA